jgi:thiamine biosynthesis protein ThiS
MKSSNSSKRKKVLAILVRKVKATVNGSAMELQDGITIENLLAQLEIDLRLVAVEQNLEIVPKVDYATRRISEGDSIEIVQFVGGG